MILEVFGDIFLLGLGRLPIGDAFESVAHFADSCKGHESCEIGG
jgi:hypothetical protein